VKLTPDAVIQEITEAEHDVAVINSIKWRYKGFRQDSKVPTFALTYDGTFNTLMTGSGLSMEKAKSIEASYHELYAVSDQWVSAKLDEASRTGYVTVAFGLRVRTPLLKQVVRKTRATPYEAEAEGRSAGNALGQSWCLLNTRGHMAFMQKVRKSEFRLDIRPTSQIHDAGYYLIRDDIRAVKYINDNLVTEVQWQEHPDIAHDKVKLSGSFGIFYPDWRTEITLPNYASEEEIFSTIDAKVA
jgi:DNA polymerase I